jgi:hypothetical protein
MQLRAVEKNQPDMAIECVRCQIEVKPWQTTAYQYGLCDACLCGGFS